MLVASPGDAAVLGLGASMGRRDADETLLIILLEELLLDAIRDGHGDRSRMAQRGSERKVAK